MVNCQTLSSVSGFYKSLYDITEILLKVALNTKTNQIFYKDICKHKYVM